MSERESPPRTRRSRARKKRQRAPDGGGRRAPTGDADALDVTWDQPQPGYPAPERPLDRAEERERDD